MICVQVKGFHLRQLLNKKQFFVINKASLLHISLYHNVVSSVSPKTRTKGMNVRGVILFYVESDFRRKKTLAAKVLKYASGIFFFCLLRNLRTVTIFLIQFPRKFFCFVFDRHERFMLYMLQEVFWDFQQNIAQWIAYAAVSSSGAGARVLVDANIIIYESKCTKVNKLQATNGVSRKTNSIYIYIFSSDHFPAQ